MLTENRNKNSFEWNVLANPFAPLDHATLVEPLLRLSEPATITFPAGHDLFAPCVEEEDVDSILAIMALCSEHRFLVVTLRPDRMAEYLSDDETEIRIGCAAGDLLDGDWIRGPGAPYRKRIEEVINLSNEFAADAFGDEEDAHEGVSDHDFLPLPNLWAGTLVANQRTADQRIPQLLEVPAALRFVRCELRQAIALDPTWLNPLKGIAWVTAYGESGEDAVPCHPDWARLVRDQCIAGRLPFTWEGWGDWKPISEMPESEYDPLYEPAPAHDPEATRRCLVDSEPVQFDGREGYGRVEGYCAYLCFYLGAEKTGRMLDGRTWDEQPDYEPAWKVGGRS